MYGIRMWGCALESTIYKVQIFQNKVLRCLVNAPYFIKTKDIIFVRDEINRIAQWHSSRLAKHTTLSWHSTGMKTEEEATCWLSAVLWVIGESTAGNSLAGLLGHYYKKYSLLVLVCKHLNDNNKYLDDHLGSVLPVERVLFYYTVKKIILKIQ